MDRLEGVGDDAWAILSQLVDLVEPGVRGTDIEAAARVLLQRSEMISPIDPSFGAVLCLCVDRDPPNTLPLPAPIRDGSVVTLDLPCGRDGLVVDVATAIGVGDSDEPGQRLIDAAAAVTASTIEACRPGALWSEVVDAAQLAAGGSANSGEVWIERGYAGHAVGRRLHERPELPYHPDEFAADFRLVAGMVFTVEPVVTDGLRSAFEERTIGVTATGPRVLAGKNRAQRAIGSD